MPPTTPAIPTYALVASTSADIALAFAQSDSIRETGGNNRSSEIDKMERVFGLCGVSYCEIGAMFDRFKAICSLVWPGVPIDDTLLKRAKTFHEQNYGPCLTGCTDTIAAYTTRKRWRTHLPDHAQAWLAQVKRGDGVIYDFSTPGHFDRHFETFLQAERDAKGNFVQDDNGCILMVTVGFNTVPDASGGSQSDGQGCYVRHRPINGTVLGSVDFNTQTP